MFIQNLYTRKHLLNKLTTLILWFAAQYLSTQMKSKFNSLLRCFYVMITFFVFSWSLHSYYLHFYMKHEVKGIKMLIWISLRFVFYFIIIRSPVRTPNSAGRWCLKCGNKMKCLWIDTFLLPFYFNCGRLYV